MATPAHELITTTNITTNTSQVTFSSIPQGYRDLELIVYNNPSSITNGYYRLNNDNSFEYDIQIIEGQGTSVTARYNQSAERAYTSFDTNVWGTGAGVLILNLMDYSQTDRYKFGLHRSNNGSRAVNMGHNMYKSNSAITRLDVYISFASGSKLSLYGILDTEA